MTRGRRLGQPATIPAGAGPSKAGGLSPLRPAHPEPAFSRSRRRCDGEICLACYRRIVGPGVRITYATLTTHAHLGCATAALKLLA